MSTLAAETSYMVPSTLAAGNCPCCGTTDLNVFHRVENVPAASCRLAPSREEALAFPRGVIELGLCRSCGFITNVAFDADVVDYSASYNETVTNSPFFRAYARDLATRLINQFDIRRKRIIEIGCGRGDFLAVLCERGENNGLGIDPSFVDGDLPPGAEGRARVIREFYSDAHAALPADLICCRHTLEHIPETAAFLRLLRESIGPRDIPIFFEVPDVRRVLNEVAFWDIHYEHCSYFSLGSLARLFRACGFDVLDVRLAYENQYIQLTARPSPGQGGSPKPTGDDVDDIVNQVNAFQSRYGEQLDHWRRVVERAAADGQRVALWGAGSKAVSFLTALQVQGEVDTLVDISPNRQYQYLCGPGHRVMPPEYLMESQPDVVIIMNPIYRDEICRDLGRMGLTPAVMTL